jgi:hypothetical protein
LIEVDDGAGVVRLPLEDPSFETGWDLPLDALLEALLSLFLTKHLISREQLGNE